MAHSGTVTSKSPPKAQLGNQRRAPFVIQDNNNISLEHFYIPEHYYAYLDSLLIAHGTIIDRVEKLAHDISLVFIILMKALFPFTSIIQDYEGETIHFLCVLKGGSTFFQDLTTALRKFRSYNRHVIISNIRKMII